MMKYKKNDKNLVGFMRATEITVNQIDNSYNHSTDPISGQPNPDFGGTYKSVVFSPGIGITYGF